MPGGGECQEEEERPEAVQARDERTGRGERRAGHHGHGRAGQQAEPAAADGGRGRRRGPGAPELNGAAAAAAGAPDETAEALGSADEELSAKLLRRADLNQGIGEPQSPSRRVFNPYTEFKEFSGSRSGHGEDVQGVSARRPCSPPTPRAGLGS